MLRDSERRRRFRVSRDALRGIVSAVEGELGSGVLSDRSSSMGVWAQVAERLMAADCKSAAPCELRRFESSPVHHDLRVLKCARRPDERNRRGFGSRGSLQAVGLGMDRKLSVALALYAVLAVLSGLPCEGKILRHGQAGGTEAGSTHHHRRPGFAHGVGNAGGQDSPW